MPNFSPNSIIRIGRVPFDNSYRHTMTFASASAQTTYFTSVCTQALSQSDYTYVRMNNSIRVPFNAESLYTYNYVMYQNKNYGNKWFYAFIVGVNYVNENMTELVLELDVMQTWYFDYTLKECFVEREHVNDDTIGAHLNPEPSIPVEYIKTNYVPEVVNYAASYIVVLLNTKISEYLSGGAFAGYVASPDSGDLYQHQYNACKAVMFPMFQADGIGSGLAQGLTDFKTFVDAVNWAGAADSICDVFMVPRWAVDETSGHLVKYASVGEFMGDKEVYTYSSASTPKLTDIAITPPSTLNGYTPKNNKLLTFPYTYLEVGDFSGRNVEYRYEFFAKDSVNKIHLLRSCAGVSDGDAFITPLGYEGLPYDFLDPTSSSYTEPFMFSIGNKISWVFSAFQNWLGQNGVTTALTMLGSLALGSTALAGGIAGVASMETAMMIAGGAGGTELASAGNIWRQSRNPNKAMGNTGTNSKLQNDYAGWYRANVTLRQEFAEIVDKFFSMYGYQVDIVKVPNREGRAKWNYVKTKNACFFGNVPADMMAKINSIYDKGITFWHSSDIGNYSAANTIVS